jgi:hypothetical protein
MLAQAPSAAAAVPVAIQEAIKIPEVIPEIGDLIQLEPTVELSVPALSQVKECSAAFAGVSLPQAASPSTTRRGQPARSIGGKRCRSRRTAARAASDRASHRRAGAALTQEPMYEVKPLSFDASRLRMQIQSGLRASKRINSLSIREGRCSMASVGSKASAGFYGEMAHIELTQQDLTHTGNCSSRGHNPRSFAATPVACSDGVVLN